MVLDANGQQNFSTTFIGNVNPIRYRGYYYDTETGLYYCLTRYYNPSWCRWISPDSIEYLEPETLNGLNLYAYCLNNPVMYYDPSGHFAFLIGVVISAAIGALYGGLTASITGQNVGAGIIIGLFAGGIMGLGAGIASSLFYSVYIAEAASIAGNLLWGSVVAFVSGFLGGAGSEAASQWANNKSIDDMDSVIRSGIQWGVVNVVSAFAVSIANPKVTSEVAVATAVFGSAIGALGMLFDVIRNKKTLPKPRSKTHTQQSYIS